LSGVSAISGGLSIGLIIPILGGSTRPIFQDTPFDFLDNYLGIFSESDFNSRIRSAAIFIIILSSIELVLNIYSGILAARVEYKVNESIADKVIKKIGQIKYKTFFAQESGTYFTFLSSDILQIGSVVYKFLVTLQPFVLLTIYLIVMASVSPYLTFASIFFFVIVSILITGILGRRLKNAQKELAEILVTLNAELNETFGNFKNILSSGIVESQLERMRASYIKFLKSRYKYSFNFTFGLPVNNFINSFSIAMLIILGAYIFRSQDESWTVLLIPFLLLLFKVLPTISQINNARNLIEANYVYNERIQRFLDLEEEPIDKNQIEFKKLNNDIAFNNVNFSYKDKTPVINNISFEIKKNKTTALLGESGSGKSTIVDLILKIYKPDNGNILIDDTDLLNINSNSLRQNISYVSQDALFFNRTIEENIKLFNTEISDKNIQNSMRILNLENVIPEIKSTLGQGGINLSSGQKQKLNFIRSYLKPSELLILDEPTSNLDFDSEDTLKKYIEEVKNDQTILLITHSRRLLELADEIVVIEKGEILDNGPSKEILKNNKYVLKMVDN
tara:strand:- start:738 stop:2426 length:1689 start_codon:yes stop_codon:yes gene_type:complete